jgi:hypothetical protein
VLSHDPGGAVGGGGGGGGGRLHGYSNINGKYLYIIVLFH